MGKKLEMSFWKREREKKISNKQRNFHFKIGKKRKLGFKYRKDGNEMYGDEIWNVRAI